MKTYLSIKIGMLISISLIFFSNFSIAQVNNYRIIYNKAKDQFTYKRLNTHEGIDSFIMLKKPPKLSKGDIVILEAEDFNTYKYTVFIEKDEKKESNTRRDTINPLLQFQKLITGPSLNFENLFKTLTAARGPIQTQEVNKSLLSKIFTYTLKSYKYFDYSNEVDQILNDKHLSGTEIKNKVSAIKNGLEKSLDESNKINTKYVREAARELTESDPDDRNRIKDDIEAGIIANAVKENYKTEVTTLIQQIDNIKLQNFSVALPPTEVETESDNIQFRLNFVEVIKEELVQKVEEPMNLENFKQIWYSGKFLDSLGEVVSKGCKTCKAIILAKGSFIGTPPLDYKDVFKDPDIYTKKNQGPFGEWEIYDERGNLLRMFNLGDPNFLPKSVAKTVTPDTLAVQKTKTDLVRISTLEAKKPLKSSFSLGVANVILFKNLQDFSIKTLPGDSIDVFTTERGNSFPVFGGFLKFESPYNHSVIPGFTLGYGASISDRTIQNFMAGPTIKMGAFKQLSFSAGYSISSVKRLKGNLREGRNKFIDTGSTDKYLQTKFESGIYFGFTLDL